MTREDLPVISAEFESFIRRCVATAWTDPTLTLDIDPEGPTLLWDSGAADEEGAAVVPPLLVDEALLVWVYSRRRRQPGAGTQPRAAVVGIIAAIGPRRPGPTRGGEVA